MVRDRTAFAVPVFGGARFDDHSMPVEVFEELSAYRELVYLIAKALFFDRHPNRRRLPNGFAGALRLAVVDIREGSAATVLVRAKASQELLFPDVFDNARDLLSETIETVAAGKAIPDRFPKSLLGQFEVFGQRLEADEWIELRRPGEPSGPRYTHEVRMKLAALAGKGFRGPISASGSVSELNAERQTFTLKVESGQAIVGPFKPSDKGALVAALAQHPRGRVVVGGTAEYSPDGQVDRIVEVTSVEEELDLPTRVGQLAALKPGWLDGQGETLDPEGLAWALDVFQTLVSASEDLAPFLYPTVEGNLQAEWSLGDHEVSAVINLRTKQASLLSVSLSGEIRGDEDVSLATEEGVIQLLQFVEQFMGQGRN